MANDPTAPATTAATVPVTVPVTASVTKRRPGAPGPVDRAANREGLRKLWRALVGIKDALALLFLLLFFWMLFAVLAGRGNAQAVGPHSGALRLSLNGSLSEQPAEIESSALMSGGSSLAQELRVRDVVRAIAKAQTDDAVKLIVLDLDRFLGGGQVSTNEVAMALRQFRKAGKPIYAYATAYTDDGYRLAAEASEIWVDPLGGPIITGPGGKNLYFKDALDRLGVDVHVYRVGTFKSAVEPYTRNDMSPEARQAADAYRAVLWDKWQADVRAARPKAQLDAWVKDPVGPARAANNNMAQAAINMGMVDRADSKMAFNRYIASKVDAPDDARPWDYAGIPLSRYMASLGQSDSTGDAVAIVPIVGEIRDGDQPLGTAGGTTIAKQILRAVADKSVRAIVLRVDSPGGSVTASEEIRQALLQASARKLPIVVSMGNVAASGGYWVSTPGAKIFAEPDTITGSIGVFGLLPSAEKLFAKWGVRSDGVTTTPLSGQPDIVGGISPQADAIGQLSVENVYARFTGLVADSRKLPIETVRQVAEGRVWAGGTAHQLKLIDSFGGLDAATRDAATRAGMTVAASEPVPVRYYEQSPDPWNAMFAAWFAPGDDEDLEQARDPLAVLARANQQQSAQLLDAVQSLIAGGGIQARCDACVEISIRPAPRATGWRAMLDWGLNALP